MLKSIKLNNYTTFINPTTIDFSATNYKFLDENIGDNKIYYIRFFNIKRKFVCFNGYGFYYRRIWSEYFCC